MQFIRDGKGKNSFFRLTNASRVGIIVKNSFRNSHEQEFGEDSREEMPDPGCHFVCRGLPIMHIKNNRGDEDRESDEEHCEEEIFA